MILRAISKCIRWWSRRWQKTSKGKWHIISPRWYATDNEFVPACNPWAVWRAASIEKRTPPKGETVCKTCKRLCDKMY